MKLHVLLFIASLLSILLLMLHFADDILREGGLAVNGVADLIAILRGDYFFVSTLLALGVLGLFSFTLSARGLWKREWAQPGQST